MPDDITAWGLTVEEMLDHLGQGTRDIIPELVGDALRDLYLTNAAFRASVHMLADMLPLYVDGIARWARATDDRLTDTDRAITRAVNEPPKLKAWLDAGGL